MRATVLLRLIYPIKFTTIFFLLLFLFWLMINFFPLFHSWSFVVIHGHSCVLLHRSSKLQLFIIGELAERSPIIIQNSSNPSSRKIFGCTTVRPTVQGATFSMRGQLYHGHYLIISPLHGHGEVANENPLILPRTLSIVGALVLLKRRAGKKMRAPLLGLPKYMYYTL